MSHASQLRTWILIVVATLFGFAAIGGGALLLTKSWLQCRALAAEESLRLEVDLSSPGVYRGKLQQQSVPEHGQQLRLIVDPPFASSDEARKLLAGLVGSVEIRRPDGKVCAHREFRAKEFPFQFSRAPIEDLGSCRGFAEIPPQVPYLFFDLSAAGLDACDFTLEVIKGPAAMKGRSQTIIGKTVWCTTTSDSPKWLGGLVIAAGLMFLFPSLRAAVQLLRKRGLPA